VCGFFDECFATTPSDIWMVSLMLVMDWIPESESDNITNLMMSYDNFDELWNQFETKLDIAWTEFEFKKKKKHLQ